MKQTLLLIGPITFLCIAPPCTVAADATLAPKSERIGVYDSRVLAYAHFWSETEQSDQNKIFAAAKEAKAKGDTNRLSELKAVMKKRQEKNHLQVFSTAPVDDVLATIKHRVELVQKQASAVSTKSFEV